jgi:hypothetical protein
MLFIGTEAPLGSAGTWNSAVNSYPGYPVLTNFEQAITGSVKSDQSGSCIVEQSGNGTDWDVSTTITVTGGTTSNINVAIIHPYLRIRYVNGGTAQGYLRLYARLATGIEDEA